jgi:hypothetical protein
LEAPLAGYLRGDDTVPLSKRPAARRRQLANLRPGAKPAPVGNRRAERHGGYARIAQRDLHSKRREVFDALSADLPLRDADGEPPAHDALAVRLLCEALCRLDTVSAYLDRHGWMTDDGGVRPAADLERRLRAEALDVVRELGLTPAARAKLGVELVRAAGAAEEAADARVARERLDARLADLDADAEEATDDGE